VRSWAIWLVKLEWRIILERVLVILEYAVDDRHTTLIDDTG
jgi:hypothetical protein